jgi:hypothetical protein
VYINNSFPLALELQVAKRLSNRLFSPFVLNNIDSKIGIEELVMNKGFSIKKI